MHKTAEFIEETKAQAETSKAESVSNQTQQSSEQKVKQQKRKRGNPNLAELNKPYRWQKGQSGNPGGRVKHDFAAKFARMVLEAAGNPDMIEQYAEGFAAQLRKGNAYTFKELAVRGYGNIAEKREIEHTFRDVSDADIDNRIAALLRDTGVAREIDEIGAPVSAGGEGKTNGHAKDTPVLP